MFLLGCVLFDCLCSHLFACVIFCFCLGVFLVVCGFLFTCLFIGNSAFVCEYVYVCVYVVCVLVLIQTLMVNGIYFWP